MWPKPQDTADLITFTEEILNGKLHFLCSATLSEWINIWMEEINCDESKKSYSKVTSSTKWYPKNDILMEQDVLESCM